MLPNGSLLLNKNIQWSIYANHYDAMCNVNPSYDSMLTLVVERFEHLQLPPDAHVLDVGGGTGNLLLRLAKLHPQTSFVHLDMDLGMLGRAREKYQAHSISNVELAHTSFLEWKQKNIAFDVIVSTNALYAIQPHQQALELMHRLLRPEGRLVLVDFGRRQNTNDWLFYVIRNCIANYGWKRTYRLVVDNWEAARQNRRTTAAQRQGHYWLHSTEEFVAALSEAQFEVEHVSSCYRGYSDIAVCRPISH